MWSSHANWGPLTECFSTLTMSNSTLLTAPLLAASGGWSLGWWAPLTLLGAWLLARLLTPPHSPRNTPEVRALPGPARPWFGWLLGNMAQLADHRETLIHPDWFQWGWTGVYESLFAQPRIYTFDPAAVAHIFAHPDEFERPRDLRTILGHIMGADSLVVNEGEKHRRMRRALNPAFSAGAIRDMLPAMYDKAGEMVALFERLLDDDSLAAYAARPAAPADRVPGARKIDVFKFAGNLTTDIIGLAGFEHDFNSLSPEADSPALLANRFNRLVDAANGMALLTEAQNILPVLDRIVGRPKGRAGADGSRRRAGASSATCAARWSGSRMCVRRGGADADARGAAHGGRHRRRRQGPPLPPRQGGDGQDGGPCALERRGARADGVAGESRRARTADPALCGEHDDGRNHQLHPLRARKAPRLAGAGARRGARRRGAPRL